MAKVVPLGCGPYCKLMGVGGDWVTLDPLVSQGYHLSADQTARLDKTPQPGGHVGLENEVCVCVCVCVCV